MQLLQEAGIIIHILPRFLSASHKLGFAEMALLKITPWSFIQYEKIQVRISISNDAHGDDYETADYDSYFQYCWQKNLCVTEIF